MRDGIRWLPYLSPTFTVDQRAAELLLPPLERTRVTITPTLINVPGLSGEQGNDSLSLPSLVAFARSPLAFPSSFDFAGWLSSRKLPGGVGDGRCRLADEHGRGSRSQHSH